VESSREGMKAGEQPLDIFYQQIYLFNALLEFPKSLPTSSIAMPKENILLTPPQSVNCSSTFQILNN
jgi:hypothetical protein